MTAAELRNIYAKAPSERARVVRAIHEARLHDAHDVLVAALRDGPWDEAAAALAELGDESDVPALTDNALHHDCSDQIPAIVKLASTRDLPLVLQVLRCAERSSFDLLVPWFVTRGSTEAIRVLRERAATVRHPDTSEGILLARAVLGDEEVLDWAAGQLRAPDRGDGGNELVAP